jgi:hypothetical protein
VFQNIVKPAWFYKVQIIKLKISIYTVSFSSRLPQKANTGYDKQNNHPYFTQNQKVSQVFIVYRNKKREKRKMGGLIANARRFLIIVMTHIRHDRSTHHRTRTRLS